MKKGPGGARRYYKECLAFVFGGRDTDSILEGLIELADGATWKEKAAASLSLVKGVPSGAGTRDVVNVMRSYSAIPQEVLQGDPTEAKRMIVRLLGCQAATSDLVVQEVLRALDGAS